MAEQTPNLQAPPDHEQSLAMRMLYEEQVRLRKELDALRKEKESKDQQQDEQRAKDAQDGDGSDEQKQGGGSNHEGEQGEQQKKKAPLKHRVSEWRNAHPLGTILITAGFIVVLITGMIVFRYLESYENTDDAFVDGHTDPISPRISGFVTGVYVENTYRVKRGQLLVDLDTRDYLAAKEHADANLAQALASVPAQQPNLPITETTQSTAVVNANLNVAASTASLVAAEGRYRAALADLKQAQANQGNAQREEERYRMLVAKEEVSRELYDQRATDRQAQDALVASRRETAEAAQKAVAQAQATLDQATAQALETRRNQPHQVAVQHETLSIRQATAKAAQAQADQAALNLSYTKIYAPEDGIVGDKQVQLGSLLQPGQEMFALTQTNDIWVTANFKETQIKRMKPGQSVTIHVDALGQYFDGYIEALSGASGAVYSLLPPENATGNYVKVVQRLPIRIRFKPGQKGMERLAPGMSVEPKVWLR